MGPKIENTGFRDKMPERGPETCIIATVMERYFESNYKKLGLLPMSAQTLNEINADRYRPYIRAMLLPAGYSLTVDFRPFTTVGPTLFFLNVNQFLQLETAGAEEGFFLYYNRDFYCIQIHDEEVSCDGFLFNNIYAMPMTTLPDGEGRRVTEAFRNIADELESSESSREEMIRTYLKQVIIRATRLWKRQQLGAVNEAPADMAFLRDFSRLVEIHFREKHSVMDYADLLAVAPKTLSKKFNRLRLGQPNDIIKDRILLEAKRLLAHSVLSIKEIGYELGYEDPAYFNRLFSQRIGATPAAFRRSYREEEPDPAG